MVILSPQLDDAVFSCGHLLATHPGSTVVTVFAGETMPELTHTPAADTAPHVYKM